jgi:hypothetical protein
MDVCSLRQEDAKTDRVIYIALDVFVSSAICVFLTIQRNFVLSKGKMPYIARS